MNILAKRHIFGKLPGDIHVLPVNFTIYSCRRSLCSNNMLPDNQYCMKLVKDHDKENYLAGLIWPKALRDSYFAVRAFNVEMALIKDQIKGNQVSGRMRFQWWKDAIYDIPEDKATHKRHPVLNELLKSYQKSHIRTVQLLINSLDARFLDLPRTQFDTLSEMEEYAEQAHSSILYSLLEILRINNNQYGIDLTKKMTNNSKDAYYSYIPLLISDCLYCTSHVGVASGITILMRGFLHHLSNVSLLFIS